MFSSMPSTVNGESFSCERKGKRLNAAWGSSDNCAACMSAFVKLIAD